MALETLIESLPSLFDGLVVTLLLTAFGILLGTTLGIVLATGRSYAKRPIAYFILIYEKVLRGIPLLVLLFLIYFGLPQIGINMDAFTAAVHRSWTSKFSLSSTDLSWSNQFYP